MPKIVGGGRPFLPAICVQSDPPPLKQRNFDQYRLIAPQPWYLAKKVQLALIGSRPRAFQRAIDEPCTLPLSPPKGGTKTDIAVCASKIQLLSKKVCYKVSLYESFQRQSCSYIIPYPTVYRSIAGDVPIYLKLAFKVTHPFRKRRFPKLSFKSAIGLGAFWSCFAPYDTLAIRWHPQKSLRRSSQGTPPLGDLNARG